MPPVPLIGLVAAPFNYIGLFVALLLVVLVAGYVWVMVDRLILRRPPRSRGDARRALPAPEQDQGAAEATNPGLDRASLGLDAEHRQEPQPAYARSSQESSHEQSHQTKR